MDKRSPLYLYSSGSLKIHDRKIYFISGYEKKSIDPENINEIYVLGEVDFDKTLLKFANDLGIIIHIFNYYGYYSGSFYPEQHNNFSDIAIKQVEHYIDAKERIMLARAFAEGAIRNILQVIRYYKNRGRNLQKIENNIMNLFDTLQTCSRINELMAIEGNVRNYYYKAFDIILDNPDFVFQQRSRRPPRNHLNTLISFGNSMLYTLVLKEIYYTHLDPRIGYLHATNFRRYTLNLDIAEIFKPIIVDRVIFTAINMKMITRKDFENHSGGIILKEKGREIFIQLTDDKLNSIIKHRGTGENVSYKDLIRMELEKLEHHIAIGKKYKPFVASW